MSHLFAPPPPMLQDVQSSSEDEREVGRGDVVSRDFYATPSPDQQFLYVPGQPPPSRYVNTVRVQVQRDPWEQSSELVTAAYDALASLTSEEAETTTAKNMLRVANAVMSALDCVEKIHPWIQVAVFAFKGIMVLEIDRRENERRVYAVLVQASATMAELFALRELELSKVTAIREQLHAVLLKIKAAIVDAGNAINKYSNCHKLARFFNSGGYKSAFTEIITKFEELKRELASVLQVQTALRVQDVAQMVEHLTNIIMAQTRTEVRIAAEVEKRGGHAACLEGGTAKIRELLNTNAVGHSRSLSRDDGTRPVDAGLLHDLRTPLALQLQDNRPLFETQFNEQMAHIQEAIDGASSRIIQAVKDGAWKHVHDPHLQIIWKRMEWAYSVPTQAFVNALREHYPDYFVAVDDHLPRPRLTSNPSSPGGSSTGYTQAWSDDGLEPIPLSHKWCLDYLNVFYVPPLTEAFDDDSNGSVHVREVDAFTRSRSFPDIWPVLPRLAYAAAGWRLELLQYQKSIQGVLNTLEAAMADLPQANRPLLRAYLDSDPIKCVKYFARGISPPSRTVALQLDVLAEERSAYLRDRLLRKLEKFKYDLSAVTDFQPIVGKRRLEHYLLPLILQLLIRHMGIIKFAEICVLDRRELEIATLSLEKVIMAAQQRRDQLEESFKQQGIDPKMRFETFAGGLYKYANPSASAESPDDILYWRQHPQFAHEIGIVTPVLSSDDLRCPSLGSVAVVETVAKMTGERAAQDVQIRAALDARAFCTDGPRYLTAAEHTIIYGDERKVSEDLTATRRAQVDLNMRTSLVVHDHYCTSCRKCPIVSKLYDCLDCGHGTFRSCEDCLSRETFPSSAHSSHHDMILYRVDTTEHMSRRYRCMAQNKLPLKLKGSAASHERQHCTRCGTDVPLEVAGPIWVSIPPEFEDELDVICDACSDTNGTKVAILVRSHLATAQSATGGFGPQMKNVNEYLKDFNSRLTTLEDQVSSRLTTLEDQFNSRLTTLEAQNSEMLKLIRGAFAAAGGSTHNSA